MPNGTRLAGGGSDPDGAGSITVGADATAKGKRVEILDGRGTPGHAQDAGMATGIFRPRRRTSSSAHPPTAR